MEVYLNSNHSVESHERMQTYFGKQIAEDLKKFENLVHRIEVHIADENSHKPGIDQIACSMEARMRKLDPIVVKCKETSIEKAVGLATEKLKARLESRVGKLKEHRQ